MATISWISTTGGDWSDGANWMGGIVPGPADVAVMNLSNTETITISIQETVQGVAFDDPAATFVETATGTLVAAGNVAIEAASIDIGGPLVVGGAVSGGSDGTVSLSTSDLIASIGTIAEAGTLVAGTLSGALSIGTILSPSNAIDALGAFEPTGGILVGGPAVISLASGPPITLVPTSFTTDWVEDNVPYEPFITVAPSNPTGSPDSFVSTVHAAGGLTPFATGETPGRFLNGPLPGGAPAWGLAMPPLAFSDAVPTVTGTGDGAVVSAIGYRPEVLAAGAGNETLIAAAGNDTLAAGNGATEMIGGTGDAIFLFVNGASGGTVTIENFVPGQDFVALRGYGSAAGVNAIASEVVGGGSSTVTLPDKSRITFANVANLTANDFR